MEGIIEGTLFEPAKYYSLGWKYGPPRGIMFHFSQFDPNRSQNLEKLASSVHFSVWDSPETFATVQHVSLMNRAWHALEASDYYFGIEHFVNEQDITLTDQQLEESARISAEIIAFAKQKWGVGIPLVRAPGVGFSPGFKEHRDGLGSQWNPLFHKDGLSNWSWSKYIDKVSTHLEEDDMALFEDKEDFRRETLGSLVGFDRENNPNMTQDDLLNVMKFIKGLDLRMKGDERPSKTDSVQKGWDLAEKIMKNSDEDGFGELPKGRIQGILTFDPPTSNF